MCSKSSNPGVNRPKIFVTQPLFPQHMELLRQYCDVDVYDAGGPPPRSILLQRARDKDGIICMVGDKIDAEVMDLSPNLVVISTNSVGYDHIDVEEATRRGIYVTNTPGVLTEATADLTWALLLAVARRIVEADNYLRAGKWKIVWTPTFFVGADVYGKTIGIIGFGRIGQAVAKRAKGFGMKILYYDVVRAPPEREAELGAEFVPIKELLKNSDFVSIHVALTKETRYMIGEKELRMMKPTAFLINTSRGPVVDEAALVKALEEKWIAGAALDVFEQEPVSPDNPLIKFSNVVLTPHIGSASISSRTKMSELAATNLLSVLRGEEPPHLVNPEVKKIRPLSTVKRL